MNREARTRENEKPDEEGNEDPYMILTEGEGLSKKKVACKNLISELVSETGCDAIFHNQDLPSLLSDIPHNICRKGIISYVDDHQIRRQAFVTQTRSI